MYEKTKNHIEDTMKFVLIYSYCTNKEDGLIALNQNAIGKYLGLTKMTIIRHFSKMKELGLISVKDKTKFTTHNNSKWYSNLYSVNQEGLNQYILEKTNYNVLDNFEEESNIYYDFMTLVKTIYNEKRLSTMTEEEKEILTDACKIFVMKGQEVHLVEGEVFNIKITYPYDLRVAETLIKGEEK